MTHPKSDQHALPLDHMGNTSARVRDPAHVRLEVLVEGVDAAMDVCDEQSGSRVDYCRKFMGGLRIVSTCKANSVKPRTLKTAGGLSRSFTSLINSASGSHASSGKGPGASPPSSTSLLLLCRGEPVHTVNRVSKAGARSIEPHARAQMVLTTHLFSRVLLLASKSAHENIESDVSERMKNE